MDYDKFPRYRPLTDTEIRLGEEVTKWLRVTVAVEFLIVLVVIGVAFAY